MRHGVGFLQNLTDIARAEQEATSAAAAASTKLQKIARGKSGRLAHGERLQERNERKAQLDRAATGIQAAARRRNVRLMVSGQADAAPGNQ